MVLWYHRTHLEETAERLTELVGEVVLRVDGQTVLQNVHRVLAALVRCSPLRRLVKAGEKSNIRGDSVDDT